jgi:hypothetical protein
MRFGCERKEHGTWGRYKVQMSWIDLDIDPAVPCHGVPCSHPCAFDLKCACRGARHYAATIPQRFDASVIRLSRAKPSAPGFESVWSRAQRRVRVSARDWWVERSKGRSRNAEARLGAGWSGILKSWHVWGCFFVAPACELEGRWRGIDLPNGSRLRRPSRWAIAKPYAMASRAVVVGRSRGAFSLNDRRRAQRREVMVDASGGSTLEAYSAPIPR